MKFDFVMVVCERRWYCNVDITFNDGMKIPESFDTLKHTIRIENHDRKNVALIPC